MFKSSFEKAKKIFLYLSFVLILSMSYGYFVKKSVMTQATNGTLSDPVFANIFDEVIFESASIPGDAKNILLNLSSKKTITGEEKEFAIDYDKTKPIGLDLLSQNREDLSGYLLISEFHPEHLECEIDLIDIDKNKVIYHWTPNIDTINKLSKVNRDFIHLEKDRNNKRNPRMNPLLLKDGSVVFHGSGAPLVKIDKCSHLLWQVDGYFHHSIQLDYDPHYLWTCDMIRPGRYKQIHEFYEDDRIVRVDVETGKVVFAKSVTDILYENHLENLLTTSYIDYQPIHLNDVQPVKNDGPFWKTGDVFLSLRTISTLLLYRPSTNKVLWYKQGPWIMQHDVDVVDNHIIGIFNNDNIIHDGEKSIQPRNQIVFYDFEINKVSRPYEVLMKKQQTQALVGGLFTLLENGDIVIEQTDHARIFRGDKMGNIKWEYQWPFIINWSRFLPDTEYDSVVNMLSNCKCNSNGSK